MELKRYKDFIIKESSDEWDDELEDEYLEGWDGIVRHDGNEKLFYLNNGTYDTTGKLELSKEDTNEGKLLYNFVSTINYEIDISELELTSLEGLPNTYAETIKCNNNKLTSLEGSPIEIGSMFIAENNNITNLIGSPLYCDEFYVGYNDKLTSLEGSPKEIRSYFDCSNNKNLKSLKSNLEEVYHFDCRNCVSLTSLEGICENIILDLDIRDCNEIKTLGDMYKTNIQGVIHYEGTQLTKYEVEYFEDVDYKKYKTSKENYYKGLIEFITKYDLSDITEDLHNVYIPESILSFSDKKELIKSLKSISKFNL